MVNNDLQLFELLSKYGFSGNALFNIIDELQFEKVNINNADKVLSVLKDIGILESTKVQQKIAKIIKDCEYDDLLDVKEVLDAAGYNSRAILERAGSILFDASKAKLEGIIAALNNLNLDTEKILIACGTLFRQSSAQKVKDIASVLKKHKVPVDVINQCTTMLVKNAAQEMDDVLFILEDHFGSSYIHLVTNCPYILAKGREKINSILCNHRGFRRFLLSHRGIFPVIWLTKRELRGFLWENVPHRSN